MALIDTYRNNVRRKKEETSRLKNEKVKYVGIVSASSSKIVKEKQQINNTKSQATIKSKLNEINREEKKKSDAEKKISEYDKRIATKEKELYNEEMKLSKEQDKEAKTQQLTYEKNIKSLNTNIELQRKSQLELSNEVKKLKKAKEKINILFIGANPKLDLNLEKEAREIRDSIVRSLNRDSINFETRWATRTNDLFQYINEVNPTIIHFSGHGNERGQLIFQDNNDNPKFVSREAIIEMINASSDDIRLVVFNNCYSSVIAESVVENIEAAIGMSISIGDNAAIQFASQLYSSIGFGLSLERAFNQAIVSLKLESIQEEETPQLYINEKFRASDIHLVTNIK